MKKRQLPEYEILEVIREIDNPELPIIDKAKRDIIVINKDKLSDTDLHRIKERSNNNGCN